MFLFSIFQEPSVSLAIQILDGAPLRPGGKIPMSVSIAKFEQKGNGPVLTTLNFDSLFHPLALRRWKVIPMQVDVFQVLSMWCYDVNMTPLDCYWIFCTGDTFIAKQADKKKKKKLKRVEDKILGWGMFLSFTSFQDLIWDGFTVVDSGWL